MATRILIIEDDASLSQMLELHFEDQGFEPDLAADCEAARSKLGAGRFDLVLLDQRLPDGFGIDLLDDILASVPDQAVIMMTGEHDLELAIDAIKKGAAEFIHKPVRSDELQAVVNKILEARPQDRDAGPPAAGRQATPPRELIGRSAAMLAVSKEIALSAASRASVLITGESGTGKEVVARLIHQHSGRGGRFVAVNCAAIVDTLLESELFGHEKGAFTGAAGRKQGKFELADGGTLFLDEVGELAPQLQAKLLRALQERVFERVGGTASIASDVRIVAATNRDLFVEAREGRFREDLIYRLNVVGIHLPPLRERREDIPLLTLALLDRIAGALDTSALTLSEAAQQRLNTHDWPGNVRELENVLTQAAVHARGGRITPDLLNLNSTIVGAPPDTDGKPVDGADFLRSLEQVEAEHIQRVLLHTEGHKGQASRILGISRPALDRKIKKYALEVPGR